MGSEKPVGGRDEGRGARLWDFSRTSAWRYVAAVLDQAGIKGPQGAPKRLRHRFGVQAVSAGVPLDMVQKWLGHAQLSTTAIYADAVGAEEKRREEHNGKDVGVSEPVSSSRLAAAGVGEPFTKAAVEALAGKAHFGCFSVVGIVQYR